MNTRKTEKVVNNHLFNKKVLATAVAAAMFGSAGAVSATIQVDTTVNTDNATNFDIGAPYTLTISGGTSLTSQASAFNGTIDGNITTPSGNVVIAGNLTMRGNIGSTNATNNITINSGNTLVIDDSVTIFTTANTTLKSDSTLNFGNSTKGYNRDTALVVTSNITMGGNSTINIGNGTTITGDIFGFAAGQGTVNVLGNWTSGGNLGSVAAGTALDLEQINISKGNTFTISDSNNATATRMNINGTVTAHGSAKISGAVTLGADGVLNLTNTGIGGTLLAATRVSGAIDAYAGTNGTLNVNGTWTTEGVIGATRALASVNLDNNVTTSGHTYTFAHNVNATTINLGHSSSNANTTLEITAGGTTAGINIAITGNIAGSTNSTATDSAAGGRLYVRGNTTVSGNIGASGDPLADIRIEDGTTLTILGADRNIYANNITLMALESTGWAPSNATLAFNGTGTTTVNGIVSGLSEGLIDINTGTVSFKDTLGTNLNYISGVNIASGANMTTASNIYVNATMVVLGRLDISNISGITINVNDANTEGFGLQVGDASVSVNATLETAGTIILSSNSTTGDQTIHSFNNATIKVNGTHSDHAATGSAYVEIGANNQTLIVQGDTVIDLDLTNTVITDGATIVIVGRGGDMNSNGTLNVSGNVTATTYRMFDITINNSTAFSSGYAANVSNASLNATVTYRTSSAMSFTGNTKTVYDSAKTAIAADTTVFQALAGMTTDTALKNAIATMHPATGGAAAASASISGSSMSTASTRMAYTRQAGLGKGMNAGGATLDESMWVQIFGANVDQDNVGGVSGYDADGQGLAIGIDGMSDDGTTRIGIAGSFANTDVTGKDSTTKTTTDIDTTQVMAYANKVNDDGSYLEGTASFAFNDNTGTRRILVGAVDRTASSAYDSTTFAVNVEAGWPQENDGTTITPTLGLAYSHLSADAYTETGAAGMNLNVTPSDYDTFEGKVGVKITGKSVDADGGIGRPEVRIGVTHNFGDDTADSTTTFTAGGASFTTTGVETDSTKVDLGLGYTYTTPEGDTDISVNIDGRSSSSYLQYGGGLTVKWKF
jgi:outer membrane autotransporter protein